MSEVIVKQADTAQTLNDNYQNDKKALNRATDRCDGKGIIILESAGEDTNWKSGGTCGAQAHVRVVKDGLDLLFCGHHYAKYESDLFLQGFTVDIDTRSSLIFNRHIGSEN